MSAPNEGRNSPEPKMNKPEQIDQMHEGHADAAPSETHSKDSSEATKEGLESNPTGPLEGAAHAKVSKDGRGFETADDA